jgi:hypothetical protein
MSVTPPALTGIILYGQNDLVGGRAKAVWQTLGPVRRTRSKVMQLQGIKPVNVAIHPITRCNYCRSPYSP